MKKRNYIKCAAGILAAIILTAGCGAEEKKVDVSALTKSLLEDVTYETELTQLDQELIGYYITLEPDVDAVMYMGSGATAEEFAIFTATDEDTAEAQKENVQEFLDDQKASFEDYIPEESKRVEDAVLLTYGNYVILSVSGTPERAQELIDRFLR